MSRGNVARLAAAAIATAQVMASPKEGEVGAVMAETLRVPGARLHYEVRGTGPMLLLIAGGPADAGVFASLADVLARHYKVVTYDPRGNSRSSLDGPPADWQADVHGDDAARLIDTMGGGPAYVFGNSGGAMVGLNLAARHPERVRALVAHEAPVVELLPDAAAHRARGQGAFDTYRSQGVGPAMQKFMTMAGLKGGPPQPAASQPSHEIDGIDGAHGAERRAVSRSRSPSDRRLRS